jgi:hypothetical protein
MVVLLVAVLVACATGIYGLGTILNHDRYAGDVVEELMYFPTGQFLKLVSMGYDTFVADFLWLKGIQYYGKHRRTDRTYLLAEHVFTSITDLDEHFLGAYRFGAFVLAEDVGQPAAGIELLRKGIRNNPRAWELPFDLGFLHFVVLKNNAMAARYFRLASQLEGAPATAARFSAFAYRRAGRNDIARSLWMEILKSSENPVMRETAEYAIRSIDTDRTIDMLTSLVGRFEEIEGRLPRNLDELAKAGLVRSIGPDPFGGFYFLDRESALVLSSTKVERDAGLAKRALLKAIERFRDSTGRYPASLDELDGSGILQGLPAVAGAPSS